MRRSRELGCKPSSFAASVYLPLACCRASMITCFLLSLMAPWNFVANDPTRKPDSTTDSGRSAGRITYDVPITRARSKAYSRSRTLLGPPELIKHDIRYGEQHL